MNRIRVAMTHRAQVSRNIGTERDPYGARIAESGESGLSPLACLLQERMARTVTSDGKLLAVRDMKLFFPRDADLAEEDTITDVRDLSGRAVSDSRLRVTSVVRYLSHGEAIVEAYG